MDIKCQLLIVCLSFLEYSRAQFPTDFPFCAAACLKNMDLSMFSKLQDSGEFKWEKFLPSMNSVCQGAAGVVDCLDKCQESVIWDQVVSLTKTGLKLTCMDRLNQLKSIGTCVAEHGKAIGETCIKGRCGKYAKILRDGDVSRWSSPFEDFNDKADADLATLCRFLGCLADCGMVASHCGQEADDMVKAFLMGTSKVVGAFYGAMKSMFATQTRQIDCLYYAGHYKEEAPKEKTEL